ncbi:MAG TPA: metalloregulator ArsR/SmtB family transcription factor [Thermodesulfobacteriota bacterium]|nr:metalloregulator ArsR/SmtB family transcription factor [Thermodesulfobacteriota bacterium]
MSNQYRHFKDSIFSQFARIGRATGSPKRLELLDLLCQAPQAVEVLAEKASLSVANASRHLSVLSAARLVEAEKQGRFVVYRIADEAVCVFLGGLRRLAEDRLAEVEQVTRRFLEGRAGMEPIDRGALLERVRKGIATVLDVRPGDEYRAGHIPGAISVPLKELEAHLKELPADREIVAYCRGPYCVLAVQAVETLITNGFKAVRLDDGVGEWRKRGFLVEVGDATE